MEHKQPTHKIYKLQFQTRLKPLLKNKIKYNIINSTLYITKHAK